MTTLVILSGRYVSTELVAEFGNLPACFIPNGIRRLYQSQIATWGKGADRIVMTLPEDYNIPRSDADFLDRVSCSIYRTKPSIELHDAIRDVIENAGIEGRLILLFGDTFVNISAEQQCADSFAVGQSPQLAMWASFEDRDGKIRFISRLGSNNRDVLAGFFDLSDAKMLADVLQLGGSFIGGLNIYAERRAVKPVYADRWLDFGHLFSYHMARRSEFDARSFNQIKSDPLTIYKTGTPERKIFAEACWYEGLPPTMRLYSPQYLGFTNQDEPGYRIEYLYLPILSELFTFGELPVRSWEVILSSCVEFLEACQQHAPRAHDIPLDFGECFFADIVLGKTIRRVKQFAEAHELDLDREWRYAGRRVPSLNKVINELLGMISPTETDSIRFWHGDFHFANIFFDFRSRRIKAIDPRGMLSDGSLSLYGDPRYDISKLCHSIIGLYDRIIAGRFHLDFEPYALSIDFDIEDCAAIIDCYYGMKAGGYALVNSEILAITAILFFSMLPLHANNRQRQLAMLANGYRLFEMARGDR